MEKASAAVGFERLLPKALGYHRSMDSESIDPVLPESAKRLLEQAPKAGAGLDAQWFAQLGEAGWFAPRWPSAQGGQGLSRALTQRWVAALLARNAPVPDALSTDGIGSLLLAAPASMIRDRLLRETALGRVRWCLAAESGLRAAPLTLHLDTSGAALELSGVSEPVVGLMEAHWGLALAQDPEAGGLTGLWLDLNGSHLARAPLAGPERQVGQGRAAALFGRLQCDALPVARELLATPRGQGAAVLEALLPYAPALDPGLASAAALKAELADLAELMRHAGLDDADGQRAALEVQVAALEALEARLAAPGSKAQPALEGLRVELAAATALAVREAQAEALGYDLLPESNPVLEHNEAPLGSALAAEKRLEIMTYRGLAAARDPLALGRAALARALAPMPGAAPDSAAETATDRLRSHPPKLPHEPPNPLK